MLNKGQSNKNSIKIFSTEYHNLKLLVFFLYNVSYVIYMLGYLGRAINLVLLFLYIFLCFIEYYKKNDGIFFAKKDLFRNEFLYAMLSIIVLIGISIIIQVYNKEFNICVFDKIIYNIIPPVLAFFWINTTYSEERYTYFLILLLRNVVYFFAVNFSKLTIDNLLAISWSDSSSSVFETLYAHDFFFLEIIFFFLGKTWLGIISMILCILNFKRISFILSLVVLCLYLFVKRSDKLKACFLQVKNINSKVCFFIMIVICIMPMVLQWLISDAGITFFANNFNIDLNLFTTGRIEIITYTLDNMEYFNGYGSIDHFIKNCPNTYYNTLGSMHCDILELYLETTIVGVVFFFGNMLRIAKKNLVVFGLMMYIFMELIASHFMYSLSVWIMFFMFAAMVYTQQQNRE